MANDILSRIVAARKEDVAAAERALPLGRLRATAEARTDHRPFAAALARPGPTGVNVIAEIKRASPSKGAIRPDLDPAALARAYAAGGAAALSVLTEPRFFRGSAEDLRRARAACALPVLRKDFLFCDYQLYESAAMGADAVLLIVRILDPAQLSDLLATAAALGLAALVEVYTAAEAQTATAAGARLVGINNRDLGSFHTDLDHALKVLPALAPGQTAVAASGIRDRADVLRYRGTPVFNFLVGESLVISDHPAGFLKSLKGENDDGRS